MITRNWIFALVSIYLSDVIDATRREGGEVRKLQGGTSDQIFAEKTNRWSDGSSFQRLFLCAFWEVFPRYRQGHFHRKTYF